MKELGCKKYQRCFACEAKYECSNKKKQERYERKRFRNAIRKKIKPGIDIESIEGV